MKNEEILKTIGLALMFVGTFAIGSYALAWYKKNKDEKEIDETLATTDSLAQNFSGAGGPTRPILINRPTNPIAARRNIRNFYTGNSGNSGLRRKTGTWTAPDGTSGCWELRDGVYYDIPCGNA